MTSKLQGIIDGQIKEADAVAVLKEAVHQSDKLMQSYRQITELIRRAEIFLIYGTSGRNVADSSFM